METVKYHASPFPTAHRFVAIAGIYSAHSTSHMGIIILISVGLPNSAQSAGSNFNSESIRIQFMSTISRKGTEG